MRTRHLVAITVALAAVGLSSCSTSGGEQVATQEPAPSSAAADDPALAIDNPKNLKAVQDACSLLTPEQMQALGGGGRGGPEPGESIFGEAECDWQGDNFGVIVGINTTTGMGPKRIQQQIETAENTEATEVAGYPAARVDEQSSICRIEVGVAEEQAFTVNYAKHAGELPEMADSCGYGEKIAAEVLKNIPDA